MPHAVHRTIVVDLYQIFYVVMYRMTILAGHRGLGCLHTLAGVLLDRLYVLAGVLHVPDCLYVLAGVLPD